MEHAGPILFYVKNGLCLWVGIYQEFFAANRETPTSRMKNTGFEDYSRGLKPLLNLAMPMLLTLSPNILQSPRDTGTGLITSWSPECVLVPLSAH